MPQQHHIDGRAVPAADGRTLPVVDPATGRAFDTLARGGVDDIDRAVQAARRAFDGAWGRTSATDRGRILTALGTIVTQHHAALSELEARDTGKPIGQARADITALARYCEYYGGAADKLHGEHLPYMADHHVVIVREPYGVTGHIIPWNYPAQTFGRSVIASLAAGNAAVVKPSEDACLVPLRMGELARQAGLPDGALNLVTGLGEEAGAALTAHPDVNYLSFTGSPQVGTLVQTAAAQRTIKCVLELGGKSPQIVFDDADLDRAVPFIVRAITQNGGQTCSAGSRLLVQRGIYDAFTARVAEAFARTRAGAPARDLDCGPMISAKQKARVEAYIREAEAAGIAVLARGAIDDAADPGGYFVAPVLFGAVPRGHRLACEEVFGPVLSALPFDDEADAIALANATDYGLVGAVWTRDGSRQTRVAKAMQCGQVFINCYGAGGGVELPFGGVKRSGHGREKGFVALEEFTQLKTVVQYHGA